MGGGEGVHLHTKQVTCLVANVFVKVQFIIIIIIIYLIYYNIIYYYYIFVSLLSNIQFLTP